MNEVEEKLFEDIINLIKDNLQLLIQNNNKDLCYFKQYSNDLTFYDFTIDQNHLNVLTKECLYALLNADFLYDFRDIE